jgi:hypothetical protein
LLVVGFFFQLPRIIRRYAISLKLCLLCLIEWFIPCLLPSMLLSRAITAERCAFTISEFKNPSGLVARLPVGGKSHGLTGVNIVGRFEACRPHCVA